MVIDFDFDFYSDARGDDPDNTSPTLRKYHRFLWSKLLPDGKEFFLEMKKGKYLYHKSELGEYVLGSDAITHSYRNQKRKQWLTKQIPNEVNELFGIGKTIASYIIYPNNKINNKYTINQARGVNKWIDDRFDLTLECIRLYYLGKQSPLFDTFERYKSYFELFHDFRGYVDFFFLNDLIDVKGNVKFYLPFDQFQTKPTFKDKADYIIYKENVIEFVLARKERMKNSYAKQRI
jgi:hypothetical protein